MAPEPLVDGHGRLIGDLRFSVTDRCNFRCQYCMPAEGLPWLERSDILTFEEIARLVGLLSEMGVRDVRLTGGEPLVRRDFPRLVAMLRELPELDEIAVTTNGFLLERDAPALVEAGVDPAMVSTHGMKARDAEVVIAAACLFHDTGMSIHRTDHEQYSLFLAADRLPGLLESVYDEPELTVVISEALHAVIGHRRRGDPITMESGIVRVADALDMASGRSRIPFETRRPNIHSLSAAAIDDVKIEPGDERAVRIEIEMNNSAGLFQVDELLATKLRGSGIEEHIEVVAQIDAEHEKRLVPVFRI